MEAQETHATPATAPKAGALARIRTVLLALVLAFVAAVAFVVMIDIGELTPCSEIGSDLSLLNDDGECFDGSDSEKTISLVLGWPGAFAAALAALLALAFAIRGRGGRPLLIAIVAGAILLGLSLLIG